MVILVSKTRCSYGEPQPHQPVASLAVLLILRENSSRLTQVSCVVVLPLWGAPGCIYQAGQVWVLVLGDPVKLTPTPKPKSRVPTVVH